MPKWDSQIFRFRVRVSHAGTYFPFGLETQRIHKKQAEGRSKQNSVKLATIEHPANKPAKRIPRRCPYRPVHPITQQYQTDRPHNRVPYLPSASRLQIAYSDLPPLIRKIEYLQDLCQTVRRDRSLSLTKWAPEINIFGRVFQYFVSQKPEVWAKHALLRGRLWDTVVHQKIHTEVKSWGYRVWSWIRRVHSYRVYNRPIQFGRQNQRFNRKWGRSSKIGLTLFWQLFGAVKGTSKFWNSFRKVCFYEDFGSSNHLLWVDSEFSLSGLTNMLERRNSYQTDRNPDSRFRQSSKWVRRNQTKVSERWILNCKKWELSR